MLRAVTRAGELHVTKRFNEITYLRDGAIFKAGCLGDLFPINLWLALHVLQNSTDDLHLRVVWLDEALSVHGGCRG